MRLDAKLLIILLSCNSLAEAANVYVSTTGSDSAAGTISEPFRTIQHGSNIAGQNSTIFVRGGVYRETVNVAQNGQQFEAYNSENVVVTGLDEVSGWTLYKDGIYQANIQAFETQFTQMFVNGEYQHMARYPNQVTGNLLDVREPGSGYDDIVVSIDGEPTGNREVTFPNMPNFPDDHWVGGYFQGISGKMWINPHGVIQGSSAGVLEVDPTFKFWESQHKNMEGLGWGFIFHLNALDIEGEWFVQGEKIYYMPPVGVNPNSLSIEAQTRQWAFRLNNKDNVKLNGINVKAASLEVLGNNNSVSESSFRYIFPYFVRNTYSAVFKPQGGIYVNGDNNSFSDCYVAHTWGNGFSIQAGSGNRVENCFIEDIGWNPQFTSSILTHATNTKIKNNTLGSTGRFHIRFRNKTDILYNDIYDAMRVGQDAGAIQATSASGTSVVDIDGTEIAYNHIHDSTALPTTQALSNGGGKQFVVALYIEDVANYTAHHNVVWNFETDTINDGTFAYLGPRRATIYDVNYYNNTVWNTHFRIRMWNRDGLGDVKDTFFTNNLFAGSMVDEESTGVLLPLIEHSNEINNGNPSDLFVDHLNGDFRLKNNGNGAINQGKHIAGITDGYSGVAPDIGAYEIGQIPWVPGADFERPCFNDELSTCAPIEDNILSIPLESEYIRGETYNVKVKYSAPEARNIIVQLRTDDGTKVAKTVNVKKSDEGKLTVPISLPNNLDTSKAFYFKAVILPIGGQWPDRITTGVSNSFNISAEVAPPPVSDEILSIPLESEYIAGQTYNVKVNYSAPVGRNFFIQFRSLTSGTKLAITAPVEAAENGTAEIPFTLPDDINTDETFVFRVVTIPIGGKWPDRLSIVASANFKVTSGDLLGDWDGDLDVDVNDISGFMRAIQLRQSIDMSFDFNNDGMINIFDARMLMAMCTKARCAI